MGLRTDISGNPSHIANRYAHSGSAKSPPRIWLTPMAAAREQSPKERWSSVVESGACRRCATLAAAQSTCLVAPRTNRTPHGVCGPVTHRHAPFLAGKRSRNLTSDATALHAAPANCAHSAALRCCCAAHSVLFQLLRSRACRGAPSVPAGNPPRTRGLASPGRRARHRSAANLQAARGPW